MDPIALYDAQSAFNFVVSQLSRIETEVYQTKYPSFDFEELVPTAGEGPEWIKSVTFFSVDWTGRAKWQSGGAFDIPYADVVRSKFEESIHMAAVGYEYNIEEINTARLVGQNLTADKAAAARLSYQIFMYNLALYGDTEKGLKGLTNNADVTAGNFPADGTGSSTYWADKTPALILRDINSLLSGIWTDSKTVEMADTILMPFLDMVYLASTPMSTTNSETILSFIQRANMYTLQTGRPLLIRGLRGLDDAGASSKSRVVAYVRDPGVLKMHIPMPFAFLPVWQNGPMNFMVPGIFRTGGVEIRRPTAVRYGDASRA